MKYTFLAVGAALFASSILTFAGTLNPRGIPTGAFALVHVDFDAGKGSQIYTTARELSTAFTTKDTSKGKAQLELFEAFQKEIGVDVSKDISGVTLGFFGDFSKIAEGNVDAVAFIRGNFTPTRIFAAAQKRGYTLTTIQNYTFIEVAGETNKSGAKSEGKFYISPFGTKTLVVLSNLSRAQSVIAAHRGGTKSFAVPASVASFGEQVGSAPTLSAYVNAKGQPKKSKNAPEGGAIGFSLDFLDFEETFFAVGDDGQDVKIRFSSLYAAESEAQEAQVAVQGLQGMVGLLLRENAPGPDGKPDPKKAADAAKLRKLLVALKVSTSGKALNLSFDYPTVEIVSLLREEAAKVLKKQGKGVAGSTSGAGNPTR